MACPAKANPAPLAAACTLPQAWGKCGTDFMGPGICDATCGRCMPGDAPAAPPSPTPNATAPLPDAGSQLGGRAGEYAKVRLLLAYLCGLHAACNIAATHAECVALHAAR